MRVVRESRGLGGRYKRQIIHSRWKERRAMMGWEEQRILVEWKKALVDPQNKVVLYEGKPLLIQIRASSSTRWAVTGRRRPSRRGATCRNRTVYTSHREHN